MSKIDFREIGVAFDMFGCPNRCRHCFVGELGDSHMTEREVRRYVGMFRSYARSGEASFFEKVWVSTCMREPDFSHDYRRLYELEAELSDGRPWRYELLSIWRLARDETYAEWARSVGPDTCQITFFGEEETTDWFCHRRGAFRDNIAATERLLAAGMKPRWQIFANTRGIGELGSLMRRVSTMRLRQRVEAMGGEFDVFVHPFAAAGRALDVEDLRPTLEQMRDIPRELIESSRKHFGRDRLWYTEGELCEDVLARAPWLGYALEPGHMPWFLVSGGGDVFFNALGTEPWWCLGNLESESVDTIIERLEQNQTPGLRTVYNVPAQELVRRYGRCDGQRVYCDADDLLRPYVARHCGGAHDDHEAV